MVLREICMVSIEHKYAEMNTILFIFIDARGGRTIILHRAVYEPRFLLLVNYFHFNNTFLKYNDPIWNTTSIDTYLSPHDTN